jgi:hypothetical protein
MRRCGRCLRGSSASRDRWASAPSRKMFHSRRRLGRWCAGSRCSTTQVPGASPRLFMFGGLLFRALNRASENHTQSPRSRVGSNRVPTALQRSDGKSMREVLGCGIRFLGVVEDQGLGAEMWGIDAELRARKSSAPHRASPLVGEGSQAPRFQFAPMRVRGVSSPSSHALKPLIRLDACAPSHLLPQGEKDDEALDQI